MIRERVDRRVLGAVRFVSAASGLVVDAPLRVAGAGLRLVRNRSGLYVLAAATGLDAVTAAFDAQPDAPAVGSVRVTMTVSDPARRYLPRRFTTGLPRQPAPAGAGGAASLFTPVDVTLFPGPSAPTGANWSIVRARVTAAGGDTGLGGALIRVVRASDSALLTRGLTDTRGEALVAVQGLPAVTWGAGDGPVVTSTTDAFLDVTFDPAADWPVDPDDLDARRDGLPKSRQPVQLTAGGLRTQRLTVSLS
jgi:hypothetical protein